MARVHRSELDEDRRRGTWAAIVGAVAVAVIVAAIIWAIAQAGDDAVGPAVTEDVATGVTLSELTSDPDAYIGQQVTLEGEVAEVYSPSAFLLDEDEALQGDDVLVYGTGLAPIEGTEVFVTGTVTQVDEEFITENGDLFLDDFSFDTIEGKVAIAAESVEDQL